MRVERDTSWDRDKSLGPNEGEFGCCAKGLDDTGNEEFGQSFRNSRAVSRFVF